jgi:hypothetical protein
MGVHNWQPMSFNEQTGLVYIPTLEMMGVYDDTGIDRAHYTIHSTQLNVGLRTWAGDVPANAGTSALLAWDPKRQSPAWSVPTPGLWNGGTMTTAGGLVFQGQADGRFNAYDGASGKLLWSFDAHMGISGAPITYTADGKQYVSVGGGLGRRAARVSSARWRRSMGGRLACSHTGLLTFALGGTATLPENAATVATKAGRRSFIRRGRRQGSRGRARVFGAVHGLPRTRRRAGGYAPDLRASTIPLNAKAFADIVQGGLLESRGMPRYPRAHRRRYRGAAPLPAVRAHEARHRSLSAWVAAHVERSTLRRHRPGACKHASGRLQRVLQQPDHDRRMRALQRLDGGPRQRAAPAGGIGSHECRARAGRRVERRLSKTHAGRQRREPLHLAARFDHHADLGRA